MRTVQEMRLGSLFAACLVPVLVVAASPLVHAAPGKGYAFMTRKVGPHTFRMQWNPCRTSVITWKANVSQAADPQAALADARVAMTALAKATGFRFTFTGETEYVPTSASFPAQAPAAITIAWVDPAGSSPSDLLGTTDGRRADGTGGASMTAWSLAGRDHAAATHGFVVMNATSAAASGFGPGLTRGQVLLHELGHVMGLAHVKDASQLMYPFIYSRAGAQYSGGDLRGLRLLGPDGTNCASSVVKRRWLGAGQVGAA